MEKKKLKDAVSWFLVVLVVLLLVLPYLPPSFGGALLVLGFATLPIILGNVVAAVIRHGRWRWVHIVAVASCLPMLMAYVPLIPPTHEQSSPTLRLVSWNVGNFMVSCDTMHQAARHINHLSPDIICFQERPHESKVSWNDIREAFPCHPHAVRNSREDEVLNLAILSSHPIVGSGERQFEGTYNRYLWADVQVGSDTVRVFNVHLQTTGMTSPFSWADVPAVLANATERDRQASLLCDDVDDSPHPTLLCGDFNDTPNGYPARRLRNELTDFSCRWPLSGTFHGMGGLLKIDYMMCDQGIQPLNYHLTDTPWSDHKLQVGEVSL